MKTIDISNSANFGQNNDMNSPKGSFDCANSKPHSTQNSSYKPKQESQTKSKPTNCKSYLLRLVNTKDYSYQELLSKSKLKGFEEEETRKLLDEFVEYRFVDERRLCEGLVSIYKGNKGPNWIFQKLITRKISKEIIKEVMSEFQSEPDPKVRELVIRKYKITEFASIDINTKKKILLFLASRGFTNGSKILSDWINTSN
jgi:SOS response regulatory protein OraA/RecX